MIKYFSVFIYLYIYVFKYKHIYRRFGERCIITFIMIWGICVSIYSRLIIMAALTV